MDELNITHVDPPFFYRGVDNLYYLHYYTYYYYAYKKSERVNPSFKTDINKLQDFLFNMLYLYKDNFTILFIKIL